MLHHMLPNNTAGAPKPSAKQAPQPAAQPALDGLMPGEEKQDEPGDEMAKDARIWKTYVREADTRDKEMVNGRNSSLDVLLIFAALFSAISTAFIIESLGDLKPDPADLAAQTQRAILQTQQAILQAIIAGTNGQMPSLPSIQPEPDSFSPARSAVVVNVLWLLSLALSVGVSLIAMLAKEWCYKFLSGRNGPLCEQGYRRQQKWDGIERWKMEEVLACLPGVMHLALLLFAIGMCIYLWGIHIAVAAPVTVVTGIVMCGYLTSALLPMVHQYCPYSTPITPVLQWCITHPILQVAEYLRDQISQVEEARSASLWGRIGTWISNHYTIGSGRAAISSQTVPMDDTTARMLAWIIVTCDDSRSVDIALQAIAGAGSSLPCAPLFTCGAHQLLQSRLSAYGDQAQKPGSRDIDGLFAALRYFRSYTALHTDDLESYLCAAESQTTNHRHSLVSGFHCVIESYDICCWLSGTIDDGCKAILLASASHTMLVARSKQFITLQERGNRRFVSNPLRDDYPVGLVIRGLHEQCIRHVSVDSATIRYVLYSVSYYLAHCDLDECCKLGGSYGLLARLCLVSGGTDTYMFRMTSVVLAAVAFTLRSYPGGEQPSQNDQATRSKRALQVMEYYQNHEPQSPEAIGLFAFGFLAVLPHLKPGSFNDCEERRQVLPLLFDGIANLNSVTTVHSLPDHCLLDGHIGLPATSLVQQQAISTNSAEATTWLNMLQNTCELELSDPQLYIPALAALRNTRSAHLQDLCVAILDSQPALPKALPTMHQLSSGVSYWEGICRQPTCTVASVSTAVSFYFRLIVASIMLCSNIVLSERQVTLHRLLLCRNGYNQLEPSEQDGHMPSSDTILCHLADDTDQQSESDCMRETMQLITDFCNAGDSAEDPEPVYPDLARRLHDIRCSRRPGVHASNFGGVLTTDDTVVTAMNGSVASMASPDSDQNMNLLTARSEAQDISHIEAMLLSGNVTA